MELSTPRKRIYIIDLLKVVACFLVFRIHMREVSAYTPFVVFAVPIFIFITSYNYTQGSFVIGAVTISQWFSARNLRKRFVRLYVPYAIFVLCQLILIFALNAGYDLGNVFISIFVGGYGPGNYYLLLMLQLIALFPFLMYCNGKKPNLTLILCLICYFCYYVPMYIFFPYYAVEVTTVGGIISKWTILRWIFLIDCGIYFYIKRDKIKWWHLVLLMLVDLVPYILVIATGQPAIAIRKIPYHFIVIGLVGLCIKYLENVSFGKLNRAVAYCGNATWHIFLFQQLYFWLIGLLNWQIGFTYLSFPICFIGGILFYTAHVLVVKLSKRFVKER